jgi:hypothetical protein
MLADSGDLKEGLVTDLVNFILFLIPYFFFFFLPSSPESFSQDTVLTDEHFKTKDQNYSLSNRDLLGTNKAIHGQC